MSTDLATLSAECGCSPTTHPDEYRDIARWGVPDLMRQYLIRASGLTLCMIPTDQTRPTLFKNRYPECHTGLKPLLPL
jgi:hypothetical protein